MIDRRRTTLADVDREIIAAKDYIDKNQSYVLDRIAHSPSPYKDLSRTTTNDIYVSPENYRKQVLPNSQEKKHQQLFSYIKAIKNLQNNLEQKTYLLQSEIRMISEDLGHKNRQITQKDDTINMLSSQVRSLQAKFTSAQQQIGHYRKQYVVASQENKKYKVDNKILMNHVHKLTKQVKTQEQKRQLLNERQFRVIRSLYKQTIIEEEGKQRQTQKKQEWTQDLTNKIKLDEALNRNGQYKNLIRRLNEEIELLKKQNKLLHEDSQQKTVNLQSQKEVVRLTEEENEKQNRVIQKMGQKLMSLENINQTLRQLMRKIQTDEDQTDSSYTKSNVKAGQFYYRT